MPRGKKSEDKAETEPPKGKYSPSGEGEVDWLGYVNVNLTAEQKEDYSAWVVSEDVGYWEAFEDAVAEGLKFGLSWDAGNSCYIATFTGCGCVGINKRCCLTARSGQYLDAIALLVFKHVVLAGGDWSSYRPRRGQFDSWG